MKTTHNAFQPVVTRPGNERCVKCSFEREFGNEKRNPLDGLAY